MAIRKRYRAKEPRRFYGFLDARVEPDNQEGASRYAREAFLFDCVDADAFDNDPGSITNPETLALVRTLSTPRRWREDLNLPQRLTETAWVELAVEGRPGEPRAWVLPARDDYRAEPPLNIARMRLITDGLPDSRGRPDLLGRLQTACKYADEGSTEASDSWLALIGAMLPSELEIRVVDVGQASCTAFFLGGKPIGYFDAGAPLGFNMKSFPRGLCHSPPSKGFVILSHWDFDHFSLAYRYPALKQLNWFAPHQMVGPNTRNFQASLGSKLHFISGPITGGLGFEMRPGHGAPTDRNGTGYSLRFDDRKGDVVVLTGDSDYSLVDPAILAGATAISIPHHCGPGTPPPSPAGGLARAVASFGTPNRYKHPNAGQFAAHVAAKWNVQQTAADKLRGVRRGSRTLYP